jgi:elongation factor Ts
MSNTDMIKELRVLTQAGMKDCKDALEESGWDLQKAVDIVKVKGLNVVSGREGKVASEGRVGIYNTKFGTPVQIMAEVNCQTDFVANGDEFKNFVQHTLWAIGEAHRNGLPFDAVSVENDRKTVVASTKENVVVRRWWVEESLDPSKVLVYPYLHSNAKIGTLVTLMASSCEMTHTDEFHALGFDLAMQVAAMSPLAVSVDKLDPEEVARQKTIFETQLTELNKPQAAWPKILDGKFNKWYTDVCLLNQESVVVPKTTVQKVIEDVGTKLGGTIQVVSFIRCQVGEGVEIKKDNLADEVAKMVEGV